MIHLRRIISCKSGSGFLMCMSGRMRWKRNAAQDSEFTKQIMNSHSAACIVSPDFWSDTRMNGSHMLTSWDFYYSSDENAHSCFICFGGYIWALPIQPGFHSQPFIYYAAGFDVMTDEPHAVWYFPRWLSYRDKSRSVAIQIILSLNCWADGTTISDRKSVV